MTRQIAFIIFFLAAMGVFSFTAWRIIRYFRITKGKFSIDRIGERLKVTLLVAFGQTKILRNPLAGVLHALVWWGFLVILAGTAEMTIDGFLGTERCFSSIGILYNVIVASGDVFGAIIVLCCLIFLARRFIIGLKRFGGVEMGKSSKIDAAIALSLIMILMISLLGMNTGYLMLNPESYVGIYPVSRIIGQISNTENRDHIFLMYESFWWTHIGMVFVFLNILPYSKHFHVIMSVPNVFLSKLDPMMKSETMESVTREIKTLLDPNAPAPGAAASTPSRFGIKDVEDITWKNFADALTCTHCGRCTSVCPANTTGKLLSPRKILVDTRHRMVEAGLKKYADASFNDGKSLIGNFISREELLACTTCHACVQECPVNIDHLSLINGMRRYLVMEEASVPAAWTTMFNNIENNGAPWQYSPSDRLKWTEGLDFRVPVMAEMVAAGEKPEMLFWVGCAGAFDERSKKVTRDMAKVLHSAGVRYAVLGTEESCTGDPARRAGNEFLFQMQAMKNIELLNSYKIEKIVTSCPHCLNTLKNEYSDLGGRYTVVHHSELIHQLLNSGAIHVTESNIFEGSKITWHDPCYLGRGNGIYDAPRQVVTAFGGKIHEMPRNKSRGYCCGAGGAQMFKEAEKGNKEVHVERTGEALSLDPDIIAVGCPFCMTMMSDGVKELNRENDVKVLDVAEIVAKKI